MTDERVARFLARLRREDVCLHAFELREGGEIVAEGYAAPFEKGQPHRMYSVSKSMVSLAVGMLVGNGLLSLDEPIVSYFPDLLPPSPDPRLLRLTLGSMLTMATCHAKTTYREGMDANWAATFFTVMPTHESDTVFAYDTSCSQVLAALCERVSGRALLDFLNDRLFAPLHADDPKHWLTDPSGVPQGGTGLCMSLRDLGKVAQCVMDGGQGLIPADYLAQAVAKQIDTPFQKNPEERYGYGRQFWRTRHGWAMYGMGGQLAVCCPEEKLLLCTLADVRLDPYGVQRIYDAFFDEIVQYRPDFLPCGTVPAYPILPHDGALPADFASSYRMADNPLDLAAVRFTGDGVVLVRSAETLTLPLNLGGVTQTALHGVPCLVTAGVYALDALRVRCQFIGDAPCGFELLLVRRGAYLTVQAQRSSDPLTAGLDGFASGEADTANV